MKWIKIPTMYVSEDLALQIMGWYATCLNPICPYFGESVFGFWIMYWITLVAFAFHALHCEAPTLYQCRQHTRTLNYVDTCLIL